jgi:hypothetical protein
MLKKILSITVLFALSYCCGQQQQCEAEAEPIKTPGKPAFILKGGPMFVQPTAGLVLRKEPNSKSPRIAILPFRMKINILGASANCTKIDGIGGCWRQISVGNYTGWLFDGYLETFRPSMSQSHYRSLAEQQCKNIGNFCECATLIEKQEIAKHPNISRVNKYRVALKLDSGAEISLVDVESESATRRYRFERRENDFYIFQVCRWEWSEREMVHAKTGRRITTFGEQLFSPDGRFFLSYQDENFSRSAIEIFDVTDEIAKRVYLLELRDISMSRIQWQDADNIEFLDPDYPDGKVRYISNKKGKWRLN